MHFYFILLLFGIGLTSIPLFSQNHALFFAVNDYTENSHFNNLKNPINDARTIAKEIQEIYGFEVLVYENPTLDKIVSLLQEWQQKNFKEKDQLFVYFSGHGAYWEQASKGYFVPKGARTGFNHYLELTTLGNIIANIPCNHILLAIDACYSGTIDQEIAFKGNPNFRRPGYNKNQKLEQVIQSQLRNISKLVITSGGKVRTPDGKDHSPFSAALLKGFRSAYTLGDGLLIYPDILGVLERVHPRPHHGTLPKHKGGGFVFIAKQIRTSIPKEIKEKEDTPPLGNLSDNLEPSNLKYNFKGYQVIQKGCQFLNESIKCSFQIKNVSKVSDLSIYVNRSKSLIYNKEYPVNIMLNGQISPTKITQTFFIGDVKNMDVFIKNNLRNSNNLLKLDISCYDTIHGRFSMIFNQLKIK